MDQTIQITAAPNGDVNFKTGELPAAYTPKVIEYKGNIEAPYAFFSARLSEDLVFTSNEVFVLSECVLIVNHSQKTILLICGENQQNKVTVLGTLKVNPEIQEIGINQPSTRRGVADLRDWIKYNRKYLHPDSNFQETLKQLQKVNTAFTTRTTNEKNGTGNELKSTQHIVDDLPAFNIIFNIRLFEGMPKERIPVKVEAEVIGGEIKFLFFSEEISTLLENQAEALIQSQIELFGDSIAIINQ